jgi:hypothetical protein
MQILHKNRKVEGKGKIDMTKIYTKNASWEFLLSCKKTQTGRFVLSTEIILVRCETSPFFMPKTTKQQNNT